MTKKSAQGCGYCIFGKVLVATLEGYLEGQEARAKDFEKRHPADYEKGRIDEIRYGAGFVEWFLDIAKRAAEEDKGV